MTPIDIPLYGSTLELLVGKWPKFKKILRKKYHVKIKHNDCACGNHFSITKNGHIKHFIWIEKFSWTIHQQAILVHELYHCVADVLEHCDITGQEATAYLLDNLVESVWTQLKEKHK
jgi:hypothetical protein